MSMNQKKPELLYKDTTFWALYTKDKLEPFGLPFIIATTVTIILIIYHTVSGSSKFIENVLLEANTIFSVSISSLGLILAALALLLVIYNKRTMHLATAAGVFQQFLLPYYVAAISWTSLSLISYFYILFFNSPFIEKNELIKLILGFTIIDLTVYSIFYTMRLVGSIISNTLLAANDDYDDEK